MITHAITRAYLIARQRTLQSEINDCYRRSQDSRASPYTREDWKSSAEFAKAELDLVNQALAELSPAPQ